MNRYIRPAILILIFFVISIIVFIGHNYYDYRITYIRILNTRGQLEELGRIIERYFQTRQKYPSDIFQLVPEYIKTMPKDPWGNPLYIDIENGFLYSFGPDRQDSTADDICFRINTPFLLKKARVMRANAKGPALQEGDVIRLYFTDRISSFGNNPDSDFLFYDYNGFPLIGMSVEAGARENEALAFGMDSRYGYVEEDSNVLDIILGKKNRIRAGFLRINLKSAGPGRKGNSILTESNAVAIPAAMPLLISQ